MTDLTVRPLNPGIRDKRVLLVGGAGFIGSHLAEALKADNDVQVYDSFSRSSDSAKSVLDGCKVIHGDVRDRDALNGAMVDVDLAFHLAAVAGIFTVTKNPLTTMEVNLIGTYNALCAAAAQEVERFVYVSSSEVYGPRVYLGKEDDQTAQGAVTEPRWGYAVSKLAGEFFAQGFYLERGLKTTSLRFFNVYGPRQVGEGAVHNFVSAAILGEPLRIYGSGLQIRAWTYVDDIVRGTLLAASQARGIGLSFNIGNPATACTLQTLARQVVRLANSPSELEFVPQNLADVELRVPDVSLAKRELGFDPQVDLEEGLRRTIAYYRGLLAK